MDEQRAILAAPETAPPASTMIRYAAIWAMSLVVLLSAVAAFCAAVDPYAVIGTPLIAGFNHDKPAASDWPRLTKAYTVQRANPATLIFGDSSSDVGFNPQSRAWPAAWRPVFNLAIDGGLPQTHLRYLQHALAFTHPSHVIIAANFTDSLVMPPRPLAAKTQDQFDFEPRMKTRADGNPNPEYWRGRLADINFATLSFTALSDSVKTVLDQDDDGGTYETALGWNSGGKFRRWARDDGFYDMATNKDLTRFPQFRRWATGKKFQIDPVLQMIRLARAHGASVTVVIMPNYADQMEGLRQLGLDSDYDTWKSELVAGIAGIPGESGTPIWDCSGFSPYTTEELPAPGDHAHRLKWFWESVHFQAELGDLMIARFTGAPGATFGTKLTAANLAGQIEAYHKAEAAWVAGHPKDVARIAQLLRGS